MKTICGNQPVVGGKFWYKSKYMDEPLEGIVAHANSDSITSTNGVFYYLNLITVEPLSDIREGKINYLLDINNI